jgi:hypothetical protein
MDLYSPAMSARLAELGEQHAESYRAARPFPHIAIDDFLPVEPLEALLRDYPAPEHLPWIRFDNEREKKLAFNEVERLPPSVRDVLVFMNSAPVLRFLENLTGIESLIPDPYYLGGGLHQIRRGGHLGVHADFNKYPRFNLDRRLNLLLYLNRDWDESYGGHLELWDSEMKRCERRIAPLFNRCVVFSTTETSFHGHPDPLNCPDDRARRSLATYYYTNGRDDGIATGAHSTVFRARPGIDDRAGSRIVAWGKRAAVAVTPPIVWSAVRLLAGR